MGPNKAINFAENNLIYSKLPTQGGMGWVLGLERVSCDLHPYDTLDTL